MKKVKVEKIINTQLLLRSQQIIAP